MLEQFIVAFQQGGSFLTHGTAARRVPLRRSGLAVMGVIPQSARQNCKQIVCEGRARQGRLQQTVHQVCLVLDLQARTLPARKGACEDTLLSTGADSWPWGSSSGTAWPCAAGQL